MAEVLRWSEADLAISEHEQGLLIQQGGERYIARNWVLTDQVKAFISECIRHGLGCAIRYRHPAPNIRMTKGINWIGFSRTPAERWVAVIDEFCPKVTRPSKVMQRIVINKHYRGIVERAGINYWFQSSNVNNIHVDFADMPAAVRVCAKNAEVVERALKTRQWEEAKRAIGLMVESHLEEYIVNNWQKQNFGRKLTFVGNQVKHMDIVARDEGKRFYVFELKRGPAGIEVYDQLIRYLRGAATTLGSSQITYGAIIAKKYDKAIIHATINGPYPVALFSFDDTREGNIIHLEASSWPSSVRNQARETV